MSELADEELRTGSPWRVPAWWLLAALVLGGLGGLLFARRDRGPQAAPSVSASTPASIASPAPVASTPASIASPAPVSALVEATYARCSVQSGHRLQLGAELVNLGAAPVTLDEVTPQFPLGGLRSITTSLGTCGQLPSGTPRDFALAPHGTEWITTTVEVRRGCPAPLPVQFSVRYTTVAGRSGSTLLNVFSDLGDVPYSGCPSR